MRVETEEMLVVKDHTYLIGKIAKLTEFGVLLAAEYVELFNIGNESTTRQIHYFCNTPGKYQMSLMFINQEPFTKLGKTWYCLKEVGVGVMGDWHWYTLDQLIICED